MAIRYRDAKRSSLFLASRFRKVRASWCLFALVQNGLRGEKRTSGSLPAVLVVRHVSHQFYTHAR